MIANGEQKLSWERFLFIFLFLFLPVNFVEYIYISHCILQLSLYSCFYFPDGNCLSVIQRLSLELLNLLEVVPEEDFSE